MKKSYRNTLFPRILAATLPVILLTLSAVSCVDTEPTFGEEFIPDDQHTWVTRDSVYFTRTYNVTAPDTIPSGGIPYPVIGTYREQQTGVLINGGAVFQMTVPPNFKNDSLYGTAPVIDSAFLRLVFREHEGNTDREQTFDLYELTERIWVDSTYYYDFDAEAISRSEPLFSFTHSGEEGYIYERIEDPDFLSRLVDTTGYWRDSLFKERFKGFYLKPRDNQNDAALYQLDLSSSQLYSFYHNENPTPDTTSVYYPFFLQDQTYGLTWNHSVSVLRRDYSGVYPELGLDDPEHPAARTIVESFGGIQTKMVFVEERIDELKQKVKDAGYSGVVINKAKLQIGYPARLMEDLDKLNPRLGMYLNFGQLSGIADFDIVTEVTYRSYQNSNYVLPYGGFPNRSRFFYEMDITRYVQRLMREDYDKHEVILGPSYPGDNLYPGSYLSMNTTVLDGSESENPPLLIITYTMFR